MSIGEKIYDVCIVGAGPAGSTAAIYIATQGKSVLLLEKEKFPRDKICGDAFTIRAQKHLEKFGILQEIVENNKGKYAKSGGFVSPSGISFIDTGSNSDRPLVMSIKRIIADEMLAKKARRAGVNLVEKYEATNPKFMESSKLWQINCRDKDKPQYRARILIAADGANSFIARSLGIVKNNPGAICSRSYIESGSHEFPYDGVVFYPKKLLPGYCALFREANDDLVFCCYITPGGKHSINELKTVHYSVLETDPFVSEALGPSPKKEKMKSAPLRPGGVEKSYGDNLLIIGDAAGHIDPLTGQGIQYAMDAAYIASVAVDKAFKRNNFSSDFFKGYHSVCMKLFGKGFKWSDKMSRTCAKYPVLLDAFASVCRKKGPSFMKNWAKIMTGSKSKLDFYMPGIALPLITESIRNYLRARN